MKKIKWNKKIVGSVIGVCLVIGIAGNVSNSVKNEEVDLVQPDCAITASNLVAIEESYKLFEDYYIKLETATLEDRELLKEADDVAAKFVDYQELVKDSEHDKNFYMKYRKWLMETEMRMSGLVQLANIDVEGDLVDTQKERLDKQKARVAEMLEFEEDIEIAKQCTAK